MQAFTHYGTHKGPSLRAAFFLTGGIQVHHWLPQANNGHDNQAPCATGTHCPVTRQSVTLDTRQPNAGQPNAGRQTMQVRRLSLLAGALLRALTTPHAYVKKGFLNLIPRLHENPLFCEPTQGRPIQGRIQIRITLCEKGASVHG